MSSGGGSPRTGAAGPGERDVVGIHERRNREPRSLALRARELTEEIGHLHREERIAHHAGVGRVGTVWFSPDPPVKAVLVEPVGAVVQVDGAGQ